MVSSEGGRSWTQRTPPAAIIDLTIDPSDIQRVVVSTERGMLVSPNAGKGWRPLGGGAARAAGMAGPQRFVSRTATSCALQTAAPVGKCGRPHDFARGRAWLGTGGRNVVARRLRLGLVIDVGLASAAQRYAPSRARPCSRVVGAMRAGSRRKASGWPPGARPATDAWVARVKPESPQHVLLLLPVEHQEGLSLPDIRSSPAGDFGDTARGLPFQRRLSATPLRRFRVQVRPADQGLRADPLWKRAPVGLLPGRG